jgi:hypothetical protein
MRQWIGNTFTIPEMSMLKWKAQKHHAVGTEPKSNRKHRRIRDNIDASNACMYTGAHKCTRQSYNFSNY